MNFIKNPFSWSNVSPLKIFNVFFIIIVAVIAVLQYFSFQSVVESAKVLTVLFFIIVASLVVEAMLISFTTSRLCKFLCIAELISIMLSQAVLFFMVHDVISKMG